MRRKRSVNDHPRLHQVFRVGSNREAEKKQAPGRGGGESRGGETKGREEKGKWGEGRAFQEKDP